MPRIPNSKNYNYQKAEQLTERDWRLSRVQLRALLNLIEHHSTIVLRGLRTVLNWLGSVVLGSTNVIIFPIRLRITSNGANFCSVIAQKMQFNLFYLLKMFCNVPWNEKRLTYCSKHAPRINSLNFLTYMSKI